MGYMFIFIFMWICSVPASGAVQDRAGLKDHIPRSASQRGVLLTNSWIRKFPLFLGSFCRLRLRDESFPSALTSPAHQHPPERAENGILIGLEWLGTPVVPLEPWIYVTSKANDTRQVTFVALLFANGPPSLIYIYIFFPFKEVGKLFFPAWKLNPLPGSSDRFFTTSLWPQPSQNHPGIYKY